MILFNLQNQILILSSMFKKDKKEEYGGYD